MIEDQSSLRKKQFEEKQKAKDADDRSMMADVDGSSAPQIAVQGVQKSPPANKESKDIKLRQAPPSESRKVSVNYQMRSAKEKGGLRLAPGRASQPSVMSEASDTKQQTVTLDLDPSFSTDSVDTVASLETDVRINMPPSAPGAYAVAGPGLLDGDEEDLESGEIRPTDEGAPPIEGTLALSLEQARAKMLAEAVVAGEVHRTTSKQRRTLITFTIVLVVLISAILSLTFLVFIPDYLWLQQTKLTGNLSFLCDTGESGLLPELVQFRADCFGEVNCSCCDYCCDSDGRCEQVYYE